MPVAPAAVAQYLALIPRANAAKPKFAAWVQALVTPFVNAQTLLQTIAYGTFDLDTAIGVQLDAVGLWVGRSRYIETQLNGVFFSWDIPAVGWDQGTWFTSYTPVEGLTALDDDTYRLLLRAKIAANSWDGTLQDAESVLSIIFPSTSSTYIFIQDNQDMTAYFSIAGLIPDATFVALFLGGYIPLKPEGAAVSYYVTSVDAAPLFGWDMETPAISGWDTGAWGVDSITEIVAAIGNYLDTSFYLDQSNLV